MLLQIFIKLRITGCHPLCFVKAITKDVKYIHFYYWSISVPLKWDELNN